MRITKVTCRRAAAIIRRTIANKSPPPMWVNIARIAKIVQNLTIIGGIFVGLGSLIFGPFGKRIEAIGEYRKDYIDHIRINYVEFLSKWTPVGHSTLTTTNDQTKTIVLDFFKDSGNQAKLLTFVDFFDGLWFCVHTKSCDQNTALDAFETQASVIYEASAYYIQDRRQQDRDSDFGAGLEKFYGLQRQRYLSRLFVIP
jgi:hypothetical protein